MRCGKPDHQPGTEVSSQECKVQRLPQNWTFPQGMPDQEKS